MEKFRPPVDNFSTGGKPPSAGAHNIPMIPSACPSHLDAPSTAAFRLVRDWILREARSAPLAVGIGGPGGCGKSTLSRWLRHHLPDALVLSLDDFRLPRSARPPRSPYGSHPDANDLPLLRQVLEDFRNGLPLRQPVFDPASGTRARVETFPSPRILLADGEIAAHQSVRAAFDRLVLVEAHWRTQLHARLSRDLRERRCSLEKAVDLFLQSNLRDYPRFSAGARAEAHAILYRNLRRSFSLRRLPRAHAKK